MAERTVLVRYRGEVQGVGFRATVRRIAADFTIKGWVKNDADGGVSMIATADAKEIEAFLAAIRSSRLGFLIEQETVEPQPRSEEGGGFNVRH